VSLKESVGAVGAVVKGDDHGTLLWIAAVSSVACFAFVVIGPSRARCDCVGGVAAVHSRTKEIENGDLVINKLTGVKGVFVDTGWDSGADHVRYLNEERENEKDYTIAAWRLARPDEQ